MILATLGKLSVSQALTAGTTDSTNVIQLPASDYIAFADAWLVITTIVAAGGSGTLTFDLVMSQESTLDTNVVVVRSYLASEADIRAATLNRHIAALNLGKMLVQMLDESGSDYPFVGLVCVLSSSATITIDAAISPTEPWSEYHRMVTDSPVGVPAIASAASGTVV